MTWENFPKTCGLGALECAPATQTARTSGSTILAPVGARSTAHVHAARAVRGPGTGRADHGPAAQLPRLYWAMGRGAYR